jgi:hypothetical protein
MSSITSHDAWFAGLRVLSDDSFPKCCRSCGREFASETDYFQQTQAIRPDITGLKAVYDDEEGALVEVFRNCVCGSTLLVNCMSRRDDSAAGSSQRQLFEELLGYLVHHGVDHAQARIELLRMVAGERSEVLEAWYSQIAARGAKPEN